MTLVGFFGEGEKKLQKATRASKKTNIDPCEKCGLYKTCKTPKMEPHGDFKKKLLVWAEAPGEDEDENTHYQLTGKSGQYLRSFLRPYHIDLDRDCLKINSVDCRPPNNRTPSQTELNCCYPRKQKVLDEYKPRVILLLGAASVDSFYGASQERNFVSLSIVSLRGKIIPDERLGAWICHSYHPAYILRGNEDKVHIFEQDMLSFVKAAKLQISKFDSSHVINSVVLLTDFDKVMGNLVALYEGKYPFVFDYETSSYRYYEKIHKLYIISFGAIDKNIGDVVYVFPYDLSVNGKDVSYWSVKQKKEIDKIWINLMLHNPKVAQNIKHESLATKCFFNVWPENWLWDTMLGSRTMDESYGVNGLKIQAYLNWGVCDYSR